MILRDNNGRVSAPPERYRQLATALGGQLIENQFGCYCRVDTVVEPFDSLGHTSLEQLRSVTDFPIAAFTLNDAPGAVAVGDLLCFDTETTGLGGAGTVPFLIGAGSVTPDGFQIRQYLLPDYSDEAALLTDLIAEFATTRSLVTYNGAAFDLPLVRDRLILNRAARDIPSARHLDLLHATRRLFKRRLKDCSLVNVERELFGHIRGEDIPGYLIPSVYFEWLNEQTTDNLRLVLAHNRQDILTLIYLCHHIAQAFATEGKSLEQIDDLHSLSRVYGRRRDTSRAVKIYDRISAEADGELAEDILLYHSYSLKRAQDWSRAAAIWHDLSGRSSREGYWACVELAKYFEHKAADFKSALQFAHRAVELCPYGDDHRARLHDRVERLLTKINPPK